MKNWIYGFVGVACVGGFFSANGESLLKATTFPKGFNDLPFVTRIQVLADGYDELKSVYNEKGECVSGCAYAGIKIEDEIAAIRRNTERANAAIVATQYSQQPTNSLPIYTFPVHPVPGIESGPTVDTAQNPENPTQNTQPVIGNNSDIIENAPINAEIRITSDFGPRKRPAAGASEVHRGIDISVPVGTPVCATANGIISRIWDNPKNGGRAVLIRHANGFYTAYYHLSNNSVRNVGDTVSVGDIVAYSGNTGVSTGPHLHYTIYHVPNNRTLNYQTDVVDPLWTENLLRVQYRFANQEIKSCLHTPRNFCGTGPVPLETLPGEIK